MLNFGKRRLSLERLISQTLFLHLKKFSKPLRPISQRRMTFALYLEPSSKQYPSHRTSRLLMTSRLPSSVLVAALSVGDARTLMYYFSRTRSLTQSHSFIVPSLICLPMPHDPTRHCQVRVTSFMEKVPSWHRSRSGMRHIISNARSYHRCLWMIQVSYIPTPL